MDKNLDFLLSEYKDRIGYLSQNLAQGACPSIEEYRYICGQIRGLESSCLVITDLKNRMEINADID
jgi:hypothetical protein